MNSRSTNGLRDTHVSMKSAREAQADAPQSTAPRSALFPLHERYRKNGRRSYRLHDSLCNGVCRIMTYVEQLDATGDQNRRDTSHRILLCRDGLPWSTAPYKLWRT